MPILANSTVNVVKLDCNGKIYIDVTVEIKGPFKIEAFLWNKKVFLIEPSQKIG